MAITTNVRSSSRSWDTRVIRLSSSLAFVLILTSFLMAAGTPLAAQVSDKQNSVVPFGPTSMDVGQIVIGPGDMLTVTVFNTLELSGTFRVDQDGKIALPVGGELSVNGLTPKQVSSAIEQRFRDEQIMLDPHVSVLITQFASQGTSILGEVKTPGIFPLVGAHTLYEALSAAGGTTSTAGSTITITHHSDPGHPIVIQVSSPNYSEVQNSTPVYPGDTVFVSQADLIWVVGDVNSSGSYPISHGKPLTLLQVLGLCHGVTPTAKISKAVVVRSTANGVVVLPINLKGIMNSTVASPVLQASDILVVPTSSFKRFLTFALPSATNSVVNAVSNSLIVR